MVWTDICPMRSPNRERKPRLHQHTTVQVRAFQLVHWINNTLFGGAQILFLWDICPLFKNFQIHRSPASGTNERTNKYHGTFEFFSRKTPTPKVCPSEIEHLKIMGCTTLIMKISLSWIQESLPFSNERMFNWRSLSTKIPRIFRNLVAKFFLRPKSKIRPHFKRKMHFYAHPENFRRKYWNM